VIAALAVLSSEAAVALAHVEDLRGTCDRDGNLPANRRGELGMLVAMLESRLS